MPKTRTLDAGNLSTAIVIRRSGLHQSGEVVQFKEKGENTNVMLQLVDIGPRSLESYRGIAPDHLLDDLLDRREGVERSAGHSCECNAIWGWCIGSAALDSPNFERSRTRCGLEDNFRR